MRFYQAMQKASKFDFFVSLAYHTLYALGVFFILGLLSFGLIMADAFFKGIF